MQQAPGCRLNGLAVFEGFQQHRHSPCPHGSCLALRIVETRDSSVSVRARSLVIFMRHGSGQYSFLSACAGAPFQLKCSSVITQAGKHGRLSDLVIEDAESDVQHSRHV